MLDLKNKELNLSKSVGNKFISLNQCGINRTQVVRKIAIFILKTLGLKTIKITLNFGVHL
jgi:hypothetical protein